MAKAEARRLMVMEEDARLRQKLGRAEQIIEAQKNSATCGATAGRGAAAMSTALELAPRAGVGLA